MKKNPLIYFKSNLLSKTGKGKEMNIYPDNFWFFKELFPTGGCKTNTDCNLAGELSQVIIKLKYCRNMR